MKSALGKSLVSCLLVILLVQAAAGALRWHLVRSHAAARPQSVPKFRMGKNKPTCVCPEKTNLRPETLDAI